MTDATTTAQGWQPNEIFREQARRFAEYRETERYRADEVEYKEGLGALLRVILAPDGLLDPDLGERLAGVVSGRIDVSSLDLSDAERALLAKATRRFFLGAGTLRRFRGHSGETSQLDESEAAAGCYITCIIGTEHPATRASSGRLIPRQAHAAHGVHGGSSCCPPSRGR
jgi:hypothetical protein